MKKTILFMISVVAALSAAATDRFYIEDFTINPGETKQVSIMLDNEIEYTAFQVDLLLPEGLTVEMDDGDYVFDLTSRKANDHTITSMLHEDGFIRIIAYSLNVKAFKGNSGALVTFNLIADDNFKGPAPRPVNKIFLLVIKDRTLRSREIQENNLFDFSRTARSFLLPLQPKSQKHYGRKRFTATTRGPGCPL